MSIYLSTNLSLISFALYSLNASRTILLEVSDGDLSRLTQLTALSVMLLLPVVPCIQFLGSIPSYNISSIPYTLPPPQLSLTPTQAPPSNSSIPFPPYPTPFTSFLANILPPTTTPTPFTPYSTPSPLPHQICSTKYK